MTLRQWRLVLAAIVRVLRDSNRIEDIHLVSDITSAGTFRGVLERSAAADLEVLRDRPEIDPTTVDLDALRRLPADTLGGAYVRHLDHNGLKLYVDQTSDEHVDDPDVRYLIHRYRQTHDIWHVLLGLGTRGHEEVLVHAFSLGLLGLPVSALIVSFGTLKHIVLEARWAVLRHGLLEAFRTGRRADPVLLVPWERSWTEPLAQVRERFRIRPCTPAFVDA